MPIPTRLLRPIASRSMSDADAADYLRRVQAEDGQSLEPAVRQAIHDFVVGLKRDGTWTAIKAACILAGARTLTGALVPLVGAAPTSANFVSGDYGRKTGLKGDGATKSLDSNRSNSADPQDSNHNAIWLTSVTAAETGRYLLGSGASGNNAILGDTNTSRSSSSRVHTFATGLIGTSRSAGASYVHLSAGVTQSRAVASAAPSAGDIFLFQRGDGAFYSSSGISYYSIGEALDLALLRSRVLTLMSALGALIP